MLVKEEHVNEENSKKGGIRMTVGEFADLVQQMRDAQRKYFPTRSSQALAESKRLESIVDQALEEREARKIPAQLDLFGGDR